MNINLQSFILIILLHNNIVKLMLIYIDFKFM